MRSSPAWSALLGRAREAWGGRRFRVHPQLVVALTALVALLEIARLLALVSRRIGYPFELEWMEGGVVDHIRVVLSGQRLYRAPSVDFTPFIYPPVYYYASAVVSRVVGVGFLAPRLVSTGALVGNLLLVSRIVWGESRRALAAIIAAGLFAATYQLSGAWMDVARVDSLFLFFVLLGAYLARFGASTTAGVLAGVFLCLAAFTKQAGFAVAPPILLAALLIAPRRGAAAVATFIAATGGALVVASKVTGGWFAYYVFELPRQHDLRLAQWRELLVDPFWGTSAVPLTLGVFALIAGGSLGGGWGRRVLYGGLFTATLVTSYASLLHVDGYANVLMPYHAVVSLCAGLGLGRLLTHPREPVAAAFGAALLVHFATLYHDRGPLLPTRADVAGGQAMISALRDSKGPLLVLGSGFYGAMAGHPELNAHPMALLDVLKTHDSARKDALTDSIVHAIQDKRYATVVTDRSIDFLPSRIKLQLQATYRIDRPLFPGDTAAALPKTGLAARPEWLWVPR